MKKCHLCELQTTEYPRNPALTADMTSMNFSGKKYGTSCMYLKTFVFFIRRKETSTVFTYVVRLSVRTADRLSRHGALFVHLIFYYKQ